MCLLSLNMFKKKMHTTLIIMKYLKKRLNIDKTQFQFKAQQVNN